MQQEIFIDLCKRYNIVDLLTETGVLLTHIMMTHIMNGTSDVQYMRNMSFYSM